MNSQQLVTDYFDREAGRFDAIYEEQKPFWERWTDRWRQVVVERHRIICALAPFQGEWSVLDVGCGPGRYAVSLAAAGAQVLGIDVAPAMIELARARAERAGVGGRCRFLVSSFTDYSRQGSHDVVVATGYFDYLEDPLPDLTKMIAACHGRLFASFPKRWEWRVPLRRLRFLLQRGFVRFYSKPELDRLLREAGADPAATAILDLGRDWLVCVRQFGK